MPSKLNLSLGCCQYDRTRALFDGRVQIEGCELMPLALRRHPDRVNGSLDAAYHADDAAGAQRSIRSRAGRVVRETERGGTAHRPSVGAASDSESAAGLGVVTSSPSRADT